jgi:hypothetical protein
MRKSIFGGAALAILMCLGTGTAHAQDGKIGVFAGYSYGTSNFGCQFECADQGLHGYSAAVTYGLNSHIGLEANFSGHNGSPNVFFEPASSTSNGESEPSTQDIYTYTFGPRITLPVGNFSLFTHFLVGGAHVHEGATDKCILATGGGTTCFNTESFIAHGNGMAFKTGAGLDWNRGHWGVRILEVDYLRSSLSTTSSESCSGCSNQPETFTVGANNFELSTGLTFHFGNK